MVRVFVQLKLYSMRVELPAGTRQHKRYGNITKIQVSFGGSLFGSDDLSIFRASDEKLVACHT